MNNKTGFNRLSRKSSHRRALLRNLVKALFEHEQIETTKAKAREVSRKAEKLITRAKVNTVHNQRLVAREISEKALVKKLFDEIAPRFAERNGGYTRVLKLGFRQGDAAEMAVIQLVERANSASSQEEGSKKKTSAKKKVAKNEEKPAAKKALA